MAKTKANTKTIQSSSFTQNAVRPPSAPEIEAAVLGAGQL